MARQVQTTKVNGKRVRIVTTTSADGTKVKVTDAPVLEWEMQAEQVRRLKALPEYGKKFLFIGGMEAGRRGKMEQVKAKVEEAAQSYENPEEVVRWYFSNPRNLAEVEAITLEDNVVQWVLSKAKTNDKAVAFDELMGAKA